MLKYINLCSRNLYTVSGYELLLFIRKSYESDNIFTHFVYRQIANSRAIRRSLLSKEGIPFVGQWKGNELQFQVLTRELLPFYNNTNIKIPRRAKHIIHNNQMFRE